MKYLSLIRHAKSDWGDSSVADFDRSLNARGRKAAPLMGARMALRMEIPELLISSPAKRARETAQQIALALEIPRDEILLHQGIYEARKEDLVRLIQGFSDQAHIALIGHNPGISDLAAWLCPGSPTHLPTCAVLVLELEINSWPKTHRECAHLLHYDYPKKVQ